MPTFTIGRAAKLYGLHRSTLYEAVAKGRVSAGLDGKGHRTIDLSELIRVYGEAPSSARQNPTLETGSQSSDPTHPTDAYTELLAELRLLRGEVRELRESLLRIEHKPPAAEPRSTPTPTPTAAPQSFADLLSSLPE